MKLTELSRDMTVETELSSTRDAEDKHMDETNIFKQETMNKKYRQENLKALEDTEIKTKQ